MAKKSSSESKARKECKFYVNASVKDFKNSILWHMERSLARATVRATPRDWWLATAMAVRDEIMGRFISTMSRQYKANSKRVYYLSLEYLMGRLTEDTLTNSGLMDVAREALKELGLDFDSIMASEVDMGLGNGGLGRLAACFQDSLATLDYPAVGYGILYEFGLFTQSFEGGRQIESPDNWLKFGSPWDIVRPEYTVKVGIGGRVEGVMSSTGDWSVRWIPEGELLGVPWDVPVVGYGAGTVNFLRLWESRATNELDLNAFNNGGYTQAVHQKAMSETISKVLYPNDKTENGKILRLMQQYFFVTCSLQDIIRRFKSLNGENWDIFADKVAIQLNDTHPAIAVPELMRLLVDVEGLGWDKSWEICTHVFAYTNHTVMQEALEKWDLALLASVCPELVAIIRKIDAKFKADMAARGAEVKATRCIIWNNQVHMAQLAVYATVATNGVAAIHTEILKDDVFADWYALYPERFQNKTNGITQRRWLGLCNPELTALIKKHIGSGFLTDLDKLEALKPQISDDLCREFIAVKKEKKAQLAAEIEKREGVKLDPNMIFDIQVKRLHEYKRQLMNTMSILHLYFCLKDGTLTDFTPTAFIFGAKAAPGYARAKAIIHLTNMVADMVNNDPDTSSLLKVVFVHNYNCSWAEKLIPAADVSEQISTAGTEASGTGNMKLMLNGAVTLGTYDGANVEITEQAGRENEYIFGATVEEINALKKNGYDPRAIYKADKEIARVLDTMVDGTFPDPDGSIKELVSSLLLGASWHKPDHYFLMRDFIEYCDARLAVNRDYRDARAFAAKCVRNVANAGVFSSDRTILEYARDIWHV